MYACYALAGAQLTPDKELPDVFLETFGSCELLASHFVRLGRYRVAAFTIETLYFEVILSLVVSNFLNLGLIEHKHLVTVRLHLHHASITLTKAFA
jgi:hypothetical protein